MTDAASRTAISAVFDAALQHHQAGRLAEAEALYRQILATDPTHADSLHLLGVRALQHGDTATAIVLISKAIGLRNDNPLYHNNLGNALQAGRRGADAVAHFERAIALDPGSAEFRYNLGNALLAQNKPAEAVTQYQQVVNLRPDFAKAYTNLGCAMHAGGNAADAIAQHELALTLDPSLADAHANLGNALADVDRFADAAMHYQRALELAPSSAEAHGNLGHALRNQGKLGEARRAYERAIELAPRSGRYYRQLTNLATAARDDPAITAMAELAQDMASLPLEDQIDLHFALGKACEDLAKYASAFRHLAAGNTLKRRALHYDETAMLALFGRIHTAFTPELLRRHTGGGDLSGTPVFIIGMPRSGTTLVEQILASHPRVFAAGELDAFPRLAASLLGSADDFRDILSDVTPVVLRQLGARYLATSGANAAGAVRMTDKMPGNFLWTGLIHLVLPNARIIHVSRDPIDTCFSCYATLFAEPQPYSYDLAELGRYYCAYVDLMTHWQRVLPPGTILHVRYEDVVGNLEQQARLVVAHCGLEWDPACLAFHQTQRPVRTASAAQVRRPIYRTSIGRWRSYKEFLHPLLGELSSGPGS